MYGPSRPRLVLADDHVLILEAFRNLLAANYEVVAAVSDGRSLLLETQRLQPHVVLTDIGMPLMNGLESIYRIKKATPQVKVICVTSNCEPELVMEAFRRGAAGYVPKTAAAAELSIAIQHVLRGESYLSPSLAGDPMHALLALQLASDSDLPLTERQVEVLQLLAEGRSMKEAAAVLNLTTRTIAFHKYRLMEHLHLRNDAEVVQYAMQHHVVFAK